MATTGFLITTGGQAQATVANPGGPYIHITQFRVGSGVNYVPAGYVPNVSPTTQSSLVGSTLYTGIPSAFTVVDADTIEVTLIIPPTVLSFSFGEVGVYLEDGTLFAICVFDSLQQHVHAAGNQAGTTWKIRARLKLQQIPAICNVTLINSPSLLEVPNWQTLFRPDLQPTGANAAIVHQNNGSGDPVFVVRDTDTEWGLVGYSRLFEGNLSDAGASSTVSGFTHPNLDVSLELPNTTSKYLIKFSSGDIRVLTSMPSTTSVTWSPPLGAAPTGVVSVWQEAGAGQRISWADTIEYNALVADVNPYWSTPGGVFPASSGGLNQVAIPTLARRTNVNDWTLILNAIKALAQIHNLSVADINAITDFVYRPTGNTPMSLQTLETQWDTLLARFAQVKVNAASLIYNATFQDFQSLPQHSDNTYFATRTYNFTFNTSSDNHRLALLNGGSRVSLSMDVISPAVPSWVALDALLNAMGTLTIFQKSCTMTGPGTGTQNFFPLTTGLRVVAAAPSWSNIFYMSHASGWEITVQGQLNASNTVLRVILQDVTSPYNYGGSPGNIQFNWAVSRPTLTLVNTPVLAFPTLSVTQV